MHQVNDNDDAVLLNNKMIILLLLFCIVFLVRNTKINLLLPLSCKWMVFPHSENTVWCSSSCRYVSWLACVFFLSFNITINTSNKDYLSKPLNQRSNIIDSHFPSFCLFLSSKCTVEQTSSCRLRPWLCWWQCCRLVERQTDRWVLSLWYIGFADTVCWDYNSASKIKNLF